MKLIKRLRRNAAGVLIATLAISSTVVSAQQIEPVRVEEAIQPVAVSKSVEIKEIRSRQINGGPNIYSLGIAGKIVGYENLNKSDIQIKISDKDDMSGAKEVSTTAFQYDKITGQVVVNNINATDTNSDKTLYVTIGVKDTNQVTKKEVKLEEKSQQYCKVDVLDNALIYNQEAAKLTVPIEITEDAWKLLATKKTYWTNIKYRKVGETKWKEQVFNQLALEDTYFLDIQNVVAGEQYEVMTKIRYTTPNGLLVDDEVTKVITVPHEVPEGIQGVRLYTPDKGVYHRESYQLAYDIYPEGVEHGELKWSSSAPNYARIDTNGLLQVTANPSTPMTIKVTLEVDGFTDSTYVTLMPIVSGATITAPSGNLFQGDQVQLEYQITPSGAVPKEVKFKSDKPEVISVDDNGIVTVHKNVRDLVKISIEADGETGVCYVTIKPKVESVTLDQTRLNMQVGESATINALINPEGQGLHYTEQLSWTSSAPEVVEVKRGNENDAKITVLQEITEPVTITATVKDFQGTSKEANCIVGVDSEQEQYRVTGNMNYQDFEVDTTAETFIQDVMRAVGVTDSSKIKNLTISQTDMKQLVFPQGLTQLNTLIVKGTEIEEMILADDMITLSDLNLEKNKISTLSIPATLTSLGKINVTNNQLSTLDLPHTLSKLIEIRAEKNQITSFNLPEECVSVRNIYLNKNKLQSFVIPAGMSKLERIEANYNELSELIIPQGLSSLNMLHFAENQIANISLSDDLGNLTGLYIGDNQLQTLDLPSGLSKVKVLSAYDNQLKDLHIPTDMNALVEIQARNNYLVNIDLTSHLGRLKTLRIEHNQFIAPINKPAQMTNYKDEYNLFTNNTDAKKYSRINVMEESIDVTEGIEVAALGRKVFIEDVEEKTSTNIVVTKREETLDSRHILKVVPVDEAAFSEVFEMVEGKIQAKKAGSAEVQLQIVGTEDNSATKTLNTLELVSDKQVTGTPVVGVSDAEVVLDGSRTNVVINGSIDLQGHKPEQIKMKYRMTGFNHDTKWQTLFNEGEVGATSTGWIEFVDGKYTMTIPTHQTLPKPTYQSDAYLEVQAVVGDEIIASEILRESIYPQLTYADPIVNADNTVTLSAEITNDGLLPIEEVGFYYTKNSGNTIPKDIKILAELQEDGRFTANIIDKLLPSTRYDTVAYTKLAGQRKDTAGGKPGDIYMKTNSKYFITEEEAVVQVEKVDDRAEKITYYGEWNEYAEADHYNGTVTHTNQHPVVGSDYVEFDFTGSGIKLISQKTTGSGKADIYIDNILVADDLDFYNNPSLYQENVFEKIDLPYGTHIIKVMPTDENNGNTHMGFSQIYIDGFEVIKDTKQVVNKESLVSVLDEVTKLSKDNYTSETWAILELAIENGKMIVQSTIASQAEVDQAVIAVNIAIAALEQVEDKRELVLSEVLINLELNQTHTLTYELVTKEMGNAVWQTDNEKVATVAADGTVTAIGSGIAKITLTIGDKIDTCMVNVIGSDNRNTLKESLETMINNTDANIHDGAYENNPLYKHIISTLTK